MFGFAVKKAIFFKFSFSFPLSFSFLFRREKKNVDFGMKLLDLKVGECCFGLGIRWVGDLCRVHGVLEDMEMKASWGSR